MFAAVPIKKQLLALAVAALVAGCGGGSDTPASNSPEAVIGALRAQSQALAASSVTSAQAAELLMNWAESEPSVSQYFPEHQQSQTDVPPFLYRHYSNGVYLGVVVTDGSGLPLNGVYVMGGPFGNAPLFVGPLSRFLPDVVVDNGGGGGGGGGGNGSCFDLALFDQEGTQSVISYVYSGEVTGNETVTSTVGAIKPFEGVQARETVVTTAGTHDSIAINTQNKFYATRSGNEVTHYGGILTGQVSGFNATIKTVISPPFVDRQYTLAVGESLTSTVHQTTTTTLTGVPFNPPPVTTDTTSTTKHVLNENIVVQGKSYNTCKFEVTTAGSAVVTTSWIVIGKGLPVKIVSGNQTIEATSATINGTPI